MLKVQLVLFAIKVFIAVVNHSLRESFRSQNILLIYQVKKSDKNFELHIDA